VVDLLGVELVEEFGGEWVVGHVLSVEDTEGVLAECGVGLAMLQRGLAFLCLATLGFLLWCRGLGVVSVEVPRRRREVPKRDRRVGNVMVASLGVWRGQCG